MFLGNVLFIPNQKQLGGKTLKMKLSRSTLGTLVAAGIKPATSWFEGLPLCSLAQQQHNTKELAELFFPLYHLSSQMWKRGDAETDETLHFLSSLNNSSVDGEEMRQMLLI